MARAKVELMGCPSYSWGKYNFAKGKPVIVEGLDAINYCRAQGGTFRVIMLDDMPMKKKKADSKKAEKPDVEKGQIPEIDEPKMRKKSSTDVEPTKGKSRGKKKKSDK